MNSHGTQPILFVCAKTPVVVFQVPLWMLPKTVRTLVERKGGIDRVTLASIWTKIMGLVNKKNLIQRIFISDS